MNLSDFITKQKRTHYAGNVSLDLEGITVTLMRWTHRRRDHGGVIFVDLRDREGIVQVVFNPERFAAAHGCAEAMRPEYVVALSGEVCRRPEGTGQTIFIPRRPSSQNNSEFAKGGNGKDIE